MIKSVFKTLRIAFFLSLVAVALLSTGARAATPTIEVLRVEGTIVPAVADYIDRGIGEAEDRNATVLIIELDTPGGLLGSTEKIVKRIMNADIPIVVYVSPQGAWAASAGTFITLSAHIAAMTPSTTIGAAHPVAGGGEEMPEDQMKKITEFAAKWMKTIAQERGRNMEEAQLAVIESKSFTDVDALDANLIDLRANNLEDLINQINGWEITLANGVEINLNTTGSETARNEMNIVERFLHVISDPNIAYILLSLGSIGIIAEIYSPGTLFPGITGAICLLLAFYSLGVLDAYWGGILLIVLAFGLFIGEVFTETFGLFTAGGITALVLGSLILFKGGAPYLQVSPWLIATVTISIAGFSAFAIHRVIRAHRRQASTGREELIGKAAMVRIALEPEGTVFFKGEHWTAVLDKGQAKPGEKVIITKTDGLVLHVTKNNKEGREVTK